ncbi:MAG: hypothetical protein DMF56_00160 [Acidobacteria bacterium]|nr:MAG: hypothetical protein DMF56_00160 [Acidobacteriota bacterium]
MTFSAMAAEVRLGPETPLSAEIEIVPAAHPQYPISIAPSGSDFLALWQTVAGTQQTFQLGRIGASAAYFIPGASSAVMAVDGDESLIAFVSGSTVYVQRAGSDGQLLGEPRIVTSKVVSPQVTHLLFDGSAFLLLVLDKIGMTTVLVVDREGTIVRELAPFWRVLWAGVQNGEFAAIDGTDLTAYVLHRFSAFEPRTDVPLNLPKDDISFVAASPNHIFVGERETATLLELDGRVVRQIGKMPCTPSERRSQSAWWDGIHFVSTCLDGFGRLDATRYMEDGTLDGAPTLLSLTADRVPLFATNRTDQLLVWPDHHFSSESDVVARVVHGSDSVAPGAELQLVSYSGRPQRAVQIARRGERRASAWRDDTATRIDVLVDGKDRITQTFDHHIGRPAIAAGETAFLEAFNDPIQERLFALLIPFSGTPASPVDLTSSGGFDDIPGIVYRNPRFSAAIGYLEPRRSTYEVHVGNVREDNVVLPDQTFGVPGDYSAPYLVLPLWTGGELRVAIAGLGGGMHYSPGVFPYWFGFSVASAGVNPVEVLRTQWFYLGPTIRTAFAPGPGRLAIAWVDGELQSQLRFAQILPDGSRVLTDPRLIPDESAPAEVAVVWNGTEYVVAWSGRVAGETSNRIRAMRVDVNGQLLDASPIAISPLGATTDRPSFAVTSTGVEIAYTRFDEQTGGSPRAFVRSLDRLPAPILRRTAVRH